jgi:hypothetical protein
MIVDLEAIEDPARGVHPSSVVSATFLESLGTILFFDMDLLRCDVMLGFCILKHDVGR